MAEAERRARMERFLREAAEAKRLRLTDRAIAFAVDRALGHIERQPLTESAKDTDVASAEQSVQRFLENVYSHSRKTSILESDIQDFVQRSSNCFFPWCAPR